MLTCTCMCLCICLLQVSSWIHEKQKTAGDQAFRDPTNLEGKIQKHQTFEAEISANKARVDEIRKVGLCVDREMAYQEIVHVHV